MVSAQWHIVLKSRVEMQTRKNIKCIRKEILEHQGAGPSSLNIYICPQAKWRKYEEEAFCAAEAVLEY
jgi:hypothetical protein